MKTTTASKPAIISASVSLLLVATLASISGLAAEGAAEKAGQQIDRTVDKAAQAASEAKESAAEKAESTGDYMDDAAITAKVKWAFLRDPALKSFQISVTTTDGVATLTGAVDSQQSIDQATAVARSIPNVKSVDNRLTVKEAN